ncbi:MAG: glutamate-cysteine ligase family protein [Eubacteriaceae bacterium]
MEYFEINKNNIIKYIEEGEKEKKDLTIGIEIEHIIVNKDSLRSITYDEEKGVEYILEQLLQYGWEKSNVGENILSLEKNDDNITLEPGAQIEVSLKNCNSIQEIDDRYISFAKDIFPILEKNNYCLLCLGYHPVTKIKEIPFIPKERYKYMSNYLQSKGNLALNMMKGTASLQVAVDYTDNIDYRKKFRVANFLSPVISLLFDNTPVFEGELWEGNIARVNVWNNVDNDRCRIIPDVLDSEFEYEDYATYMLNKPSVISLIDGEFVYTEEKLIKEIYDEIEMTEEQIIHLLTMFFPDVRTKKYIEIRMADSVPYPYSIAAASLWKGILYDNKNLEYFYNLSKEYSNNTVEDIKKRLISNEKEVFQEVSELIDLVLKKSQSGLMEEEKKYLQPLIDLKQSDINLSNKMKKKLKKGEYKEINMHALNLNILRREK